MPPSHQIPFSVETFIPVCAGDLPSYGVSVSSSEMLEVVVKKMERNPELPGVIVIGKKHISIISRAKMFERLGHQYGVELFLHRPISKLEEALKARALLIPAQTRIEEAARMALLRPKSEVYDPIVITDEDQDGVRLVDMLVLLLAQSQILSNIANTVEKLEQLERVVSAKITDEEMLLSSLELLSHVVPYHQAVILMQKDLRMEVVARRGVGWGSRKTDPADNIQNSEIYKMMLKTRQAICLTDVNTVPDWEYFDGMRNLRSWMGVPLMSDSELKGILSIGRLTHSPFNKTEKDTAQVFASRMLQGLENKSVQLAQKR